MAEDRLQARSYAAGFFELALDGKDTTAYLKSVEGGQIKGNTSDEPIGPDNMRIKRLSTHEVEPITMEIGMAGSAAVLEWIKGSWDKSWNRRSGQITHADFNLKSQLQHEFNDALIMETTFPALDGSSKDPGYLKVKIQPESVSYKKSGGEKIQGKVGTQKQKMWINNAFRLTLDGVAGLEYTNKIESFTIKQNIQKMFMGPERFPQIEPTGIVFPTLSCTMALKHADGLLKWHDEALVSGQAATKMQKTGVLEYFAPDRKKVIFKIDLYQVGLTSLEIPHTTANENQIKRVKFELYVGAMNLDGPGSLGME